MPVIFASSSNAVSNFHAVKAGKLRKLASKIYTDDLRSPPKEIVRRHRLEIAAHFYPGAVISHRSALEARVSPGGKFHLTVPGAAAPVRKLPGLEIRLWKGPGPQPGDVALPLHEGGELFSSSQERALLENLQIARPRGKDEPKVLPAEELEKWLDRRVRIHGPEWLNDLERRARELAAALGWERERAELEQLLGAFRGEPSNRRLATDIARSRSRGKPYDPDRITLFSTLHARLAAERFVELPRSPVEELENRAFWEAYFSNFIEGTKFSVEEARVIVYDQNAARELRRKRPEDAHDVRETYRLIVDPNISAEVPANTGRFIELLKRRHARMMASRATVEPGVFKKVKNEVGSRVFVAPDLVVETLVRGWPPGRTLPSATSRALYVLFLIAEVHPFKDGNGRISRLGMNAELEQAGQARLIIPTSFRSDYLSVLEALTLQHNPEPFVAFGHKLVDINSRIPFGSFEDSHDYFHKTGALDEPSAAHFDLSTFRDTPTQ